MPREITKEGKFTGCGLRRLNTANTATEFYMAQQASNKGTLVPGQKISVNSYTVQVERYLSQGSSFMPTSVDLRNVTLVGGFAYVYLVRTPTPVYGTTHHVLKRIAVPNESMLTEVKKEVDIMVRRHPESCSRVSN